MPRVNITNHEQKAAFDAVYKIIEAGIIKKVGTITVSADKGVIYHGNMSYAYVSGLESDEREDGEDSPRKTESFSITEDGASWFGVMRGQQSPDAGDSAWVVFLGDFSSEYHKQFFLTTYRKRSRESEGKLSDNLGRTVSAFLSKVYPSIGALSVTGSEGGNGTEAVYVLTLRMQIGTTMGEKIPLIGKLVLSKSAELSSFRERDLVAVGAADAREMLKEFKTYSEGEMPEQLGVLRMADKSTAESALLEIGKKVSGIITNNENDPISDYVFFEGTSESKLLGMLAKLAENDRELRCDKIEVLGVSSIVWEITSLDISDSKGNKLFRVKGGTDNKISIKCLGCGAELVTNNECRLSFEDGTRHKIVFDFSKKNFGISDSDLKLVASSNEFKEHYIPRSNVVCNHGDRAKKCSPYKCKVHLTTLPEGVTVCKACKYPEIVYTGADGAMHYTPRAVFAADVMRLVPKEAAAVCKGHCGRYIMKSANARDNLCPLCKEAMNPGKGAESAEKRYKKYASLLPLEVRLFGAGYTKLCYEDSEMIIFVMASNNSGLIPKKTYVFHKLWAQDGSTVKAPVKIKG